MSDSLRNKLIRLAHSNPELQADLLPLLKEANYETDVYDSQIGRITEAVVDVLEVNHAHPTSQDEKDLTERLTRLIPLLGLSVRNPRALAQDLLYQVKIKAEYKVGTPAKVEGIVGDYTIPSSKPSRYRFHS